ncbi:MAG: FAD-dependent monooxygenase [Phycisphaeraceae bacterium]|nr:FAD-dependent monooxygenase [Phycisphaerales bacterium]MCB9860863.1 FAD-dependent monooxygenase [Phycisphaeraceae bacterium]
MDLSNTHVLIVGAGLGGSLLACDLAKHGARVTLCERRSDPRAAGFIGGRSINLAMGTRGLTALKRVGLDEAVLKDAVKMPGRLMHSVTGELTFQGYSKDGKHTNYSVSRSQLNITLLEAADTYDHVTLRFDCRCVDVDFDEPSAVFERSDGWHETIKADIIVGADGAFSAVRDQMMRTSGFNYSQDYLSHGYKELHIPNLAELRELGAEIKDDTNAPFAMEKHALHIWPRGSSMMIALPNADGTFTCTLFWPMEGKDSFAEVDALSDDGAKAFFRKHYGDAVPVMPTLIEDYRNNPTSRLVTIRCEPWNMGTNTVLIGDAAHAVVPFYGQGMQASFEDCRILMEMLEQHNGDFARVIPAFAEARKPNGDAIADLAIENFVEMRDKVGHKSFLYKKKFDKFLARTIPQWETLYDMVSFSNIPYAEAKKRAKTQWFVVELIIGVIFVIVSMALVAVLRSVF